MGKYSTATGGCTIILMVVGQRFLAWFGWGVDALLLSVLVGTVQNVGTKATKYGMFDPTKEMAYIPLDAEQKTKGKAAIDVIASRMGKSGGSLIQQFLILFLGTLSACAPYIGL